MALLEIRDLCRSFGGLHAVNAVSFGVDEGSITALIGPNGAGKTTLFNCIGGSLRPDSGDIRFRSRSISGQPPHRVAACGISRTFQNVKIFPRLPVIDNVLVGHHRRTRAGLLAGMLALRSAAAEERRSRERAMALLERLDIAALHDRPAGDLAFGQQRAVELARALASEPTLVLLDEPAAGLNMHETAAVGAMIRRIRDDGITVLLVEHDMSLVMDISDTVVVLSNGERIARGTPREVQRDPEVVRVYLGDEHA